MFLFEGCNIQEFVHGTFLGLFITNLLVNKELPVTITFYDMNKNDSGLESTFLTFVIYFLRYTRASSNPPQ